MMITIRDVTVKKSMNVASQKQSNDQHEDDLHLK